MGILFQRILVCRGLCKVGAGTLTVLPAWCVPGGTYSLPARQQAIARLGRGTSVEEAPDCHRDANRLPDASTVRRWVWRCVESVCFWMATPTLLAWDWRAAGRIPGAEASSP